MTSKYVITLQPILIIAGILLSLFLAPISGIAQVSFDEISISENSVGSINNCVADMNGDYLDDIVRVVDDLIVISYQEANGQFRDRRINMEMRAIPFWSIAVGDLDANGFNDMILGDQSAVSFVYADNNGSFYRDCLLYTSPSPRDKRQSRMPSSA